jgi:hypothetical protein
MGPGVRRDDERAKRDLGVLICPTGKSVVVFLSSPLCKNISLNPSGKSSLELPPSCLEGGALANVINAGWDAMDAEARLTKRADADGEVVWS